MRFLYHLIVTGPVLAIISLLFWSAHPLFVPLGGAIILATPFGSPRAWGPVIASVFA